MTSWADVEPVIASQVETAMGWGSGLAYWDTDPAPAEGEFARLSIVSSIDEGERVTTTDPDTLIVSQLMETRAQIQILFESYEGMQSATMAEQCRRYFKRESTQSALAALGISVVQEPGPVRSVPYFHDGFWVSASQFELPIRFNHLDVDPNADPNPTTAVGFSGSAGGVTVPSQQVSKP